MTKDFEVFGYDVLPMRRMTALESSTGDNFLVLRHVILDFVGSLVEGHGFPEHHVIEMKLGMKAFMARGYLRSKLELSSVTDLGTTIYYVVRP